MKGLLPALGILTAVSSTAAIAAPGSSGSPVFSCSLGKKSVLVTAVGKTLLYQFGTLRGPEMSLVGDPKRGNVHYKADPFGRSEIRGLRFSNGPYSYILFNYFAALDQRKEGGIDKSGLLVFRGSQKISEMTCKSGKGFSDTYDLKWVPEDNFEMPDL